VSLHGYFEKNAPRSGGEKERGIQKIKAAGKGELKNFLYGVKDQTENVTPAIGGEEGPTSNGKQGKGEGSGL